MTVTEREILKPPLVVTVEGSDKDVPKSCGERIRAPQRAQGILPGHHLPHGDGAHDHRADRPQGGESMREGVDRVGEHTVGEHRVGEHRVRLHTVGEYFVGKHRVG